VWKPIKVEIYTPEIKPLVLDTVNEILNNLTNSDLIQDEDWEQVKLKDSQDNTLIKHS
jgi:hypothetical protein